MEITECLKQYRLPWLQGSDRDHRVSQAVKVTMVTGIRQGSLSFSNSEGYHGYRGQTGITECLKQYRLPWLQGSDGDHSVSETVQVTMVTGVRWRSLSVSNSTGYHGYRGQTGITECLKQ